MNFAEISEAEGVVAEDPNGEIQLWLRSRATKRRSANFWRR